MSSSAGASDRSDDAAAQPREFFPDEDIIDYVRDAYGSRMAVKLLDFMECDPETETGFMRSVKRSLTREMERAMSEQAD